MAKKKSSSQIVKSLTAEEYPQVLPSSPSYFEAYASTDIYLGTNPANPTSYQHYFSGRWLKIYSITISWFGGTAGELLVCDNLSTPTNAQFRAYLINNSGITNPPQMLYYVFSEPIILKDVLRIDTPFLFNNGSFHCAITIVGKVVNSL